VTDLFTSGLRTIDFTRLASTLLGCIAVTGCFLAISLGIQSSVYEQVSTSFVRVYARTRNQVRERLAHLDERIVAWGKTSDSQMARLAVDRIQRTRKRQEAERVIRELPHMIDVITLSVAAGLGFDQALESYTQAHDGILSHHFGRALQYWQTGLKLRAEALDDVVTELESRELARFVSALKQSLVLGTALVYVLEAQGSEARDAHKQHVETRIAKTPVKMLMPMAACVIPSLLLLLLGPVVIDVMRGLGSGL